MVALALAALLQTPCDTKFARLAKYCGACDAILATTVNTCGKCNAKTITVKVCEKVGYRCADCGRVYPKDGSCAEGHASTALKKLLDASRLVFACPDALCAIMENVEGKCTNSTCEHFGKDLVRRCLNSGTAPHLPGYPGPSSKTERDEATPVDPVKTVKDPAAYFREQLGQAVTFYVSQNDPETAQVILAVSEAAELGVPGDGRALAAKIAASDTLVRANLPTLENAAAACADVYDAAHPKPTREQELRGKMIRYLPAFVQALRTINDARLGLKQKPVSMDAKTSVDCMQHAYYTSHTGDMGHAEKRESGFYTAAGAGAAARSVVSGGDIATGMRGWLNSFYHRLPLINPGLRAVGMGCVVVRDGPGSNSLADCQTHSSRMSAEIVYPFSGAVDVPVNFGGESPNPLPSSTARGTSADPRTRRSTRRESAGPIFHRPVRI
jgi:hypothetical protein